MTTTIFTGHTLDLLDIEAVGAATLEKNDFTLTSKITLEIFLKSGNRIREVYFKADSRQAEALLVELQKLRALRDELVTAWRYAIRDATLTTEDPSEAYTPVHVTINDAKPIIEFDHE